MQAGGIEPDIVVPQLCDPTRTIATSPERARSRPSRPLDQPRATDDEKLYEDDDAKDPRFATTAAELLEERGIKDFQLDYSINTLKRIETALKRPAPGESDQG